MNRVINLKFDKSLTGLAGFEYGEKVFKEQVGNKQFDTVVFPKNIELVASSFTQGFFKILIEKKGADYILNHIKIVSENEDVVKKVRSDIY